MQHPHSSVLASVHPPDRFRNSMMSGGVHDSNGSAAPLVGLYNNSTDGKYLFVYGLQAAQNGSTNNGIFAGMVKGKIPGATAASQTPLKPDEPITAGVTEWLSGTSLYVTNPILVMSNTIGFYQWPYAYPVAILPPGWELVVEFEGSPTTYGAFFQWYAGEPTDDRPLIVEGI